MTTQEKSLLREAVAAVMAEVHGLKKDEKNSHGGYNYVSVDSFKELIRPLMAKHKLSMAMTEKSFELIEIANSKGGVTTCAKIAFAISINHPQEMGPEEVATIILPYTGAQTAGAARSYVLKEFLKGKFLVATGDKDFITGGSDADAYPQQDFSTSKPKTAYRARKDGTDAEFKRIMDGLNVIEKQGSMEDLTLFWKNNQPKLKEMPQGWVDELVAKKDELKAAFSEGHEKPLVPHNPATGELYDDPSTEDDAYDTHTSNPDPEGYK